MIYLAIGGVELRAGVTGETAEAIAEAARPVMSKIETTIAEMAKPGASATDIAEGMLNILVIIWSGDAWTRWSLPSSAT